VFKLQKQIYRASQRGDIRTVHKLQKLLMKSWAAKCLAVRRVTQDNTGKKTAGVDGVKALSPEARIELVGRLKLGNKARPTRRIWIPKPGKEEKRPLGIPTMYDRAVQALVKLALEPEWEAQFEPNSYGFRPGRSAHDAIKAIWDNVVHKPKYVLDADIAKCFDKINHSVLLKKVNTFPKLRRQIKAWLKAGVMEDTQFSETEEGTPQGGVISPLLANIALHGMEEMLNQYIETVPLRSGGRAISKEQKRKTLAVIRYADDFVVIHPELKVVQECQGKIAKWLAEIGLELKPSKTRLAHTLEEFNGEQAGFNFLGFNIRQFHVGKHHSGKTGGKRSKLLGFKTLIRPSRDNIKAHWEALTKIINGCKAGTQSELIQKLNPVLRGWANYFSVVNSKETYNDLDNLLWQKLRAWVNRRHPTKSASWKAQKYWKRIGNDRWKFATKLESDDPIILVNHRETQIKQIDFIKVKGEKSPFDGDLVYWSSRMGKHPQCSKTVASLLKRQKGKCPHCGLYFRDGDLWEKDHKNPRALGGKNGYENLQLLHRHCHDEKTKNDLELIRNERYA
jgi:RNA-directed DNA polymerase